MHSPVTLLAFVLVVAVPLGPRAGLHAQEGATEAMITILRSDAPVNVDAPDLPHVEPYVAARPRTSSHLLAGAIVASPVRGEGPWHCSVFRTTDAGDSWARHDFDMQGCVDPWVVFTEDGGALFSGIEILEEGEGRERLRLVVFRSEDGGRSWPAAPTTLGRAFDHELITVDRRNGTVWLASQRTVPNPTGGSGQLAVLLRSDDNGETFEPRARIRPSGLPLRPTGIEALSDGTLVMTIHDRLPDGRDEPGSRRAWSVVSTDGGKTFSPPLFVTEACGPAGGFAGYPFLAADASAGPFRDRLYHVCVRGGFDGIALTRSEDGGRSWTDPVRVDGTPAEGRAHVRTPMVAVDGEGRVGVAWYDRRLDPERACQDVFFVASTDGGVTFTEPMRVSTETWCPDAPGNGRVGESWPMGGDYSSLAGLPGGGFHLVWADSRTGVFQLRHARLRVDDRGSDPNSEVGTP